MNETTLLNVAMGKLKMVDLKLEWVIAEGENAEDLPATIELPLDSNLYKELAILEKECGHKIASWDTTNALANDPDTKVSKAYVVLFKPNEGLPIIYGVYNNEDDASAAMTVSFCKYLDEIKGEYGLGDRKAIEMVVEAMGDNESNDAHFFKSENLTFLYNSTMAMNCTTFEGFYVKHTKFYVND